MSDEPGIIARLMSSDVDEMLADQEQVFLSIIPSRADWSYLRHYLGGIGLVLLGLLVLLVNLFWRQPPLGALSYGIIVFGGVWLLYIEVRRRFERYHFTDQKVVAETGMVNREFTTVSYDTVTHIDMHQSMMQRLLDIADFELHTAGTNLSEMWVNGVKQPLYLTEDETLFSFLQRTTNGDGETIN